MAMAFRDRTPKQHLPCPVLSFNGGASFNEPLAYDDVSALLPIV